MPLTEDYTFKLGDSGVVLNTSPSLPFVDITGVAGLDNAPYRETERDHEGQDGGFMDAEFEKGRPIVLTGDIFGSPGSVESYLDLLKANWAPSTTLLPFYFKSPGIAERLVYVKPLGCKYDWDRDLRFGKLPVQLKMFAEDPRLYASTQSLVSIPFAVGASTGFGFNLGFSFGFGGTSGTDGQFVTNSGNRPTPLQFTINGPCDTPTIRDDTYGHVLAFNIILAAGETLVIDTYYKTVKLNGVSNRRGKLIDPDWFFLQPGSTFIRYNAVSGTGSSLDIRYRSAWR